MIVCVILAYYSEKRTNEIHRRGHRYSVSDDPAYLALVLVLVLFTGLRRSYNDTWTYISGFQNIPGIVEHLSDPESWNPFKNPLFYAYESLLRGLTDNAQWLIFSCSAVTQICFLRFFKRYSHNFTFTILIFFALGTINVSLAAMKQVLAMAIVTLAFPCLEKKQWVRYYAIVLVAMLVHTYAIAYAVLPLFAKRPWKLFTYLFVAAVAFLMMNFRETISAFMDQAEELGKKLYDEEIFDENTINIFRLAVYAVGPLISFLFSKWIFRNSRKMDHVLVHMSIISFAFMVMGTQSGANMFARMAHYFEIGTACCLPWMLKQTFNERSYRLVTTLAVICFLGFFVYANGISSSFDQAYQATSITKLLFP